MSRMERCVARPLMHSQQFWRYVITELSSQTSAEAERARAVIANWQELNFIKIYQKDMNSMHTESLAPIAWACAGQRQSSPASGTQLSGNGLVRLERRCLDFVKPVSAVA